MKKEKKNITKNDEKKASRAVVDTKSLDGSTRSGGIDRSGAALPLAYRKLNTALEPKELAELVKQSRNRNDLKKKMKDATASL